MNKKHQRESYQDLLKWGREEGGGFRSSSYNIYMNYQTCVYILVISTVQPSFCSSTPNPNVLVYSLLNRVSCVPACQLGIRASMVYVSTCLGANVSKACQLLISTCQCVNKHANVPLGVPVFQLGTPTCQFLKLRCQRSKKGANFSSTSLKKC